MAKDDIDADAAAVAGHSKPSTRIPLDRDRIIATAGAFLEDHGLAALSMRKLGAELGVEAMSLYRYVSGREELLDVLLESMIDEMYADDDVPQSPEHGWQDYLQRLAHGVRRVALAHPKAFPLVASRPPEAPWLRPPLRSLRWVESFLDALTSEGFTEEAAVAAYRGSTSFLLGHLLLEVSSLGADVGPLDVLDDDSETGDGPGPRDFPLVHRMSRELAEDHSAAEFEESLENLLDRLTLIRTEHRS